MFIASLSNEPCCFLKGDAEGLRRNSNECKKVDFHQISKKFEDLTTGLSTLQSRKEISKILRGLVARERRRLPSRPVKCPTDFFKNMVHVACQFNKLLLVILTVYLSKNGRSWPEKSSKKHWKLDKNLDFQKTIKTSIFSKKNVNLVGFAWNFDRIREIPA